MRVGWLLAAVIGLAVVTWQWSAGPSLPTLSGVTLPGAPKPERQRGTAELTRRVDELVKAFSGEAAIWIADAGDPKPLYVRNEDEEVVAGSLYKLGVMLHVESLIERRELKLSDTIEIEDQDIMFDGSYVFPGDKVTIEKALELMITLSDNGTALAFWRIYGPRAINATLDRAGYGGMRIGDENEDNFVTARAAGELMTRIAEGKLVSKAASDRMLGRLERQTINGRGDALLPEGTRVAHKTGGLPGLFHDAAIVFTRIGPRVVVVLTWDAGEDEAYELMARVALAAYETAR